MRKLIYLLCFFNLACNPFARRQIPPQEPETVAVENEELEALIIDFLQAAGKPKRDSLRTEIIRYADRGQLPAKVTIKVKRDGLTFLLPLRFLHIETDQRPSQSNPDFATLTPPMKGEALDLSWDENGQTLYLLFPDSLVEVSSQGETSTYRFPPEQVRSQKPRFAAGLLSRQLVKKQRLLLSTSSLKETLIFDLSLGSFRPILSTDFPDRNTKADWYLPESQNVYISLDDQIPVQRFLALRWLSDKSAALLDETGTLRLVRDSRLLWVAERPWGKRLFRMGPNLVAVCNDIDSSFVLFERAGDKFEFAGQSPTFPDRILAIAALEQENNSGLAIVAGSAGLCRVYWVEHEHMEWLSPGDFALPQFPGATARTTILNPKWPDEPETATNVPAPARLTLVSDTPVKKIGQILSNDWITTLTSDSSFRTWEIAVRQPVFLSDGSGLTTGRVVQAWEKNWRDCFARECPGRWLWLVIAGAPEFVNGQADAVGGLTLIDDFRLQIKLTEPRPLLKEHLAHSCFALPQHHESGEPVSGAFSVDEKRLNPNPHYRHGKPELSQVILANGSQDEIISTFQENPFITLLREPQLIDYFRKLPGGRVEPFPTPSVYFVAFNTFRAPFSESGVRKYVASLARPDELQQIITAGVCRARDTLFTVAANGIAPVEEIAPATTPPIEIVFRHDDAIARQIAERLTARLRQAGMAIAAARGLRENEWRRRLKGGDYSLLVASFEPIYNTPIYNLAHLIYEGYNVEADILLKLNKGLRGDSEAATEIETLLLENVVLRPLLEARNYLLYPVNLRDIVMTGPATLDISRAWIAAPLEH
jgi:hypothetical protein